MKVETSMLASCWRVTDANVSCINKERQALLDFKQGLLDDYGRLYSWGNTEDCCKWIGVHCNPQSGHVGMLHLPDETREQPLRGNISTSLMELQHLSYLNLSHNDFNGNHIPKFFGSLRKLRYLDLSRGSFGGEIAYQLGKLSSLWVLYLNGNNLNGTIPYQFGNLSNLEELDLSSNNLVGFIPSQLGNLSNLQELWLGDNANLKVDQKSWSWLSNLPYLTYLDLSHVSNLNYSNVLLETFDNLPNLNELYLENCSLTDNNFQSLPPSHLNCSAPLEVLDLSTNKLVSSLPWLLNLSYNLVGLFVHDNLLSGPIPNGFGKIGNHLEVLDLSNNKLNGTVSDIHFDNLTRLQGLFFSSNSLTLKFSNSWIPPFQLQYLSLRYCNIGPDFPKWLRTQNNLVYIAFENAGISDSIPEWFWNLTRGLEYLHLGVNNITGTIPNLPLDHFSNNLEIYLSDNQVEGSIPFFVFAASWIDFSENNFSELSIPCDKNISTFVETLGVLYLFANQLSGQLPDCWGYFKSLAVVDLTLNRFSGKIPASLGSIPHLQLLVLRYNFFTGELPSMNNCTQLQFFDVADNELSGSISPWIENCPLRLQTLILRKNRFDGNLPPSLCHLTSLRVLDLSFNSFTGSIPTCINNFTAMTRKLVSDSNTREVDFYKNGTLVATGHFNLDTSLVWKRQELGIRDNNRLLNIIHLSHNHLSGEIPIGIQNLTELVSLNLSANNLSGKIISELGELKFLEILDLSSNHFFGEIPTSLADLSMLSNLDLSNNSLPGQIPIGTQLQSFDVSSFEGNPDLCGKPLSKLCSCEEPSKCGGQEKHIDNDDKVFPFFKGFYESLGEGFAVGFWVVFGSLLLIRSWRHAYFNFLNKLSDYIYVTAMLLVARWRE